jgi:HD superfamily phosphohydrolase
MHLMEKTLDHLRAVGDLGSSKFTDLLKVGLAAALLHDLGHGPLSHVSEKLFNFKHEAITARIIMREPISEILSEGGVDAKRVVKVLNHTATKRDVLLSQLVSSELDVDRLDYLTRDAFYTGAGFGNVDLDRITTMLRICRSGELENHAITLYKGRYAIESYVLGRHLMYQAVYFHKATRGVEKLIQRAFLRATRSGSKASIPRDFDFLNSGNQPTVDDILGMDDHTVLNTLKQWKKSKDRILCDLCSRIFERRLLKAIELTPKWENAYMTGLDKRFSHLARMHGINPDYYCPIDGPSETPYTTYTIAPKDDKSTVITNIFAYNEEDKPVEISDISDAVGALTKTKYLNRLYMPDEIKNEAEKLFKGS